jgi:opacity protein-like surface antigen
MKIKLLVAAAATVVASSAMAQSAFEGAYGQVGIGYENNAPKTSNWVDTTNPGANIGVSDGTKGGFSGAIGLGYNFAVTKEFLLGLGVDYSPLSNTTTTNLVGGDGGNFTQEYKISNRFNVFITPGYAIDKEKLAYFKAGYSAQNIKAQGQVGNAGGNPSGTQSGYILGLGYKQIITGGIYGFGEANYMSYGNKSLTNSYPEGGVDTYSVKASAYQFLVGVGYKF